MDKFNFKDKEICKRLKLENNLKIFSFICFVLFFVVACFLVPILICFEFVLGFVALCYFLIICSLMYFSAIKHKNASKALHSQQTPPQIIKKIKQTISEGGNNEISKS